MAEIERNDSGERQLERMLKALGTGQGGVPKMFVLVGLPAAGKTRRGVIWSGPGWFRESQPDQHGAFGGGAGRALCVRSFGMTRVVR